MTTHSIYALCEPGTLEVRYIGRTRYSIKQRAQAHYEKARYHPGRLPVEQWIAQLGKKPDVVLLTTCPDDLVREVERAWILLFIDNGYDMLNIRDCDKKGKKSKHRINRCDDPVYFRSLIDRLITEESELNHAVQS